MNLIRLMLFIIVLNKKKNHGNNLETSLNPLQFVMTSPFFNILTKSILSSVPNGIPSFFKVRICD